MKKELIPIFFACDDAYAPYLTVMIKSLVDNANTKDYNYIIHVLATDLTLENQSKIRTVIKKGFKIKFENLSVEIDDILGKMSSRLRDYYTVSIYYRIFIPTLFPNYHKALYLDADMVAIDDVSKLYETELGDNLLAACRDGVVPTNDILKEYVEKAVGVDKWEDYFNSGVLVMNLDKMRQDMIQEKFVYLLDKYNFKTVAPDQDYLNAICKNKVVYLDKGWDVMPNVDTSFDEKNFHIIHYNMFQKPWTYDNVKYGQYFWEYAKKTLYYHKIEKVKKSYTDERRKSDIEGAAKMVDNAKKIIEDKVKFKDVLTDEFWNENDEALKQKSEERVRVIKNIEKAIMEGDYNKKVEEGDHIVSEEDRKKVIYRYDVMKKKVRHKIEFEVANVITATIASRVNRDTTIVGIENIKDVDSGAIITSNHFSKVDTTIIRKLMSKIRKTRKYSIVVQEDNFFMKGALGWILKNNKTIPLCLNHSYIENTFNPTIEKMLKKKYYILIYPEQEMWFNYRKPRALKIGAYHYAAKYNVPIIPCFTKIEDTDEIGDDGFKKSKYTLYVMPPIYPDPNKTLKQNKEEMRQKDFELKVEAYEKAYGRKYDEPFDVTKDIAGYK